MNTQDKHGLKYLRYWFDEATGTVFRLSDAPSKEAAIAVHRELTAFWQIKLSKCRKGGNTAAPASANAPGPRVRRRLAPHRRPGDIVLLENLKAHKASVVRTIIERRGATVKYLPPYSHDFSPIEAVWVLIKKHVRTDAPRTRDALRRVVRAARYVVSSHHRHQFAHAGYVNSSA